jgi:hypothetical protein
MCSAFQTLCKNDDEPEGRDENVGKWHVDESWVNAEMGARK